eukprot:GHUV01007196.1.p1 GENE.GHUV01007196.1~~GHUV01007196.1.p1  ORF type:complete len:123 (+),score=46.15 GHUV01007196.1:133-501(+)
MAEEQAQEQMEEVLDYNEGEQAGDHADAAAAETAEEQPQAEAAENGTAEADTQMQEKPADAAAASTDVNKMDPLSQPPHGTEVYASNIPMEATEEQVKNFFADMGEVFQLRLPRNPDGRNRG